MEKTKTRKGVRKPLPNKRSKQFCCYPLGMKQKKKMSPCPNRLNHLIAKLLNSISDTYFVYFNTAVESFFVFYCFCRYMDKVIGKLAKYAYEY